MESLQRKQEASRNSSNGFKQHRSQPSASSSSTQRHQRETSAASSSARAPSSTRPESRASAISEHPLAPAPASASRRPSLTLAHVPPVDHQGSCGQPQNAHLASPSVQQTPQTGMSNLSNLSAPFVYEPSSALYAPLNDTSPQGLEKKASISSPTFESYHPHDLHGPILPGSYTRRGRGGSSSGKSTRGLGPSRNSTSSRNNHQPDSPSSRSHSGRNGNLSHYSFPSYEAYPAAYPAFDFYPQGQAWYAVNGGFYPTLPTAQYMHYQPAIGPYVDGGTGLPFERPHPNNYHLLVDPPLEPTSYWVLGQIEFYMSEDNLARDPFLRQQVCLVADSLCLPKLTFPLLDGH